MTTFEGSAYGTPSAGVTLSRLGAVALALILVARSTHPSDDLAWTLLGAAVLTLSTSARPLTAVVGGSLTWVLGTVLLVERPGDLSFGRPEVTNLLLMLLAGALAAIVVIVRRRAAA